MMTLVNTIITEKNNNKLDLLKEYNFKNSKLPIWVIILNDSLIDEVLINAIKILPANFLIVSNKEFDNNLNYSFIKDENLNSWFDFVISDLLHDNLRDYLVKWITPILNSSHHLSSILSEFNAAKVEWNAFIYENDSLCDIYYATIRYLENYKFPYDNKALVKNILSI